MKTINLNEERNKKTACFAGETCLHLAARLQDKFIFYYLVFSHDADVNSTVRYVRCSTTDDDSKSKLQGSIAKAKHLVFDVVSNHHIIANLRLSVPAKDL